MDIEALLCESCPAFPSCHIGEEIPDPECWNWRREHNLPLWQAPPEPQIDPTPPKAARRKRTQQPKPRIPLELHKKHGPPPAPVRDDLALMQERMQGEFAEASIRTSYYSLRRIPEEALSDLSIAPEWIELRTGIRNLSTHVIRYRRYVLRAELQPRQRGPQDADTRQRAVRTWKENFIRRNFGERTPPVLCAAIADRPDLWRYAEILTNDETVKKNTIHTAIWAIGLFSAEDLANSAEAPEALVERVCSDRSPETKARLVTRIRHYREVFGIRSPVRAFLKYSTFEHQVLKGAATPEEAWTAYQAAFPETTRRLTGVIAEWQRLQKSTAPA
jgi:hypothetical protein